MTELLEFPEIEIELSDAELERLEASGGCQGTTLGLGGLHLGFGHHLTLGFGGGFGFGGFYGGNPVVVQQPVALVPMQTVAAVVEPVAQTVAATSCSQGVTLAAGC